MSESLWGIKMSDNRAVIAVLIFVALGISYAFGSWAIDSGSYWHYLDALVAFIIALKLVGIFIKVGKSGKKRR